MKATRSWKKRILAFAVFLLAPLSASALDLQAASGFTAATRSYNAGGGISFTKEGDLLLLTTDYVNGPTLLLADANGDSFPPAPIPLAQFDFTNYGDFVQVSPSGKFAVVGLSGASSPVYLVDLATNSAKLLFDAPGNYDFAFIDDDKGYLSANPNGFDPTGANEVSLVVFSAGPSVTPVLTVAGVPSGPVVTNENGDLFYIKSTFAFPPAPGSFTFMKFTAGHLIDAAISGTPITEAWGTINLPLDGGYDLAYVHSPVSGPQVFISQINSDVLLYKEFAATLETFLHVEDPTFPAVTALSVFRPLGAFDANSVSQTVIAASLATNFFNDYSVIDIRSTNFDSDGDNVADSADLCPSDGQKSAPLACGCNNPEADVNFDAVVDCGLPRPFSAAVSPQIGGVSGNFLLVENFDGNSAEYKVEFRGPIPKRGKKSYTKKGNLIDMSKLKKGSYYVRYQVSQKVGRKRVKSQWSETMLVTKN